jgi:hypothetical protein
MFRPGAFAFPHILVILLAFMALSSCKTRRVLDKSPLVPLSDNALMELVTMNTFDFVSLNGKVSVNALSETQSGSFRINLRMRSDSIIWMSITPALGIEAARVVLEPDSLKFIDKLKNSYYAGPFDILDSLINYYAEFEIVQNLLVGNPIQINPDEKYSSSVEGLNYILSTKAKRKVRKSLDQIPDTTGAAFLEIVKEKKFEKAKDRFEDEDLIIKRYFVRPGDFKVVQVHIDDVQYQRSLRVYYGDFELVDGQQFPMSIRIDASSPSESAKFELSYSRIRLDEPQTYPFKIPSKYSSIR